MLVFEEETSLPETEGAFSLSLIFFLLNSIFPLHFYYHEYRQSNFRLIGNKVDDMDYTMDKLEASNPRRAVGLVGKQVFPVVVMRNNLFL